MMQYYYEKEKKYQKEIGTYAIYGTTGDSDIVYKATESSPPKEFTGWSQISLGDNQAFDYTGSPYMGPRSFAPLKVDTPSR